MKFPVADWLPSFLVASALVASVAVFVSETDSFRRAVAEWASRDLESRTALAAARLAEPLRTGDFRQIHEFGDSCAKDGVRLTVFSDLGGVVFDSVGDPSSQAESLYASLESGEFRVRLGIPLERVLAPYARARYGFILAALVGGAGVMLVLLFTMRQRMRLKELARERDAKARLLEEMEKVEAFRRDFIADVSHEIKTPLTGIVGSVDLLASGSVPEDMRPRLLSMLKSESERLNNLAQGILDLSRLENAGCSASGMKETDLAEILRDVAERFRATAEAKSMSVRVDAPASAVAVCDAALIEGAVSNLLANAIRHSESPDVTLKVSAANGSVTISVEDHGIGVPEEERERIFERFHRVDGARSEDTGGAGLGLAIVRRIARLHGGNALCTPSHPHGSTFSLTIKANKMNA